MLGKTYIFNSKDNAYFSSLNGKKVVVNQENYDNIPDRVVVQLIKEDGTPYGLEFTSDVGSLTEVCKNCDGMELHLDEICAECGREA
jgi:hypothetical protein